MIWENFLKFFGEKIKKYLKIYCVFKQEIKKIFILYNKKICLITYKIILF